MGRLELTSFNLNLLVALDGLLRERSVTAAAKRARVTPSAMSHSLSELRELLGDPLLLRSGRAMVLTPRAEALVGPLHALLMDTERLLQGSKQSLQVGQGSLYPSLYRLEGQGFIRSDWGTTENNRRARYYALTAAGRKHLTQEIKDWKRMARAINLVLEAAGA